MGILSIIGIMLISRVKQNLVLSIDTLHHFVAYSPDAAKHV